MIVPATVYAECTVDLTLPGAQAVCAAVEAGHVQVGTLPLRDVTYDLGGRTNHTFSTLFPIYDWAVDKGYDNLGMWIELAAKKAGNKRA